MANRGWDWQKQDEEAAAVDQTEREGGADLITAGALAGKEHGTSFKCGRRGRRGCGLRPAVRAVSQGDALASPCKPDCTYTCCPSIHLPYLNCLCRLTRLR